MTGDTVFINGDGEISRDFCYVANVVQANLLAAATENPDAVNQVYNIAVGERTSLNELPCLIQSELHTRLPRLWIDPPPHRDFRAGDVRRSLANIDKARSMLGYRPSHTVAQGMRESMDWYVNDLAAARA